MFDLSLVELAFIAAFTILIIGPKELPTVLRTIGKWMREISKIVQEFRHGIDEMVGSEDISTLKQQVNKEINYIRDQEGKLQKTYDISDLVDEKQEAKSDD